MLRHNRTITVKSMMFVAAPLAALLGGCAEEAELDGICEWVVSPDECGVAETGDEEEEKEDYADCTLAADGQTRTVYQCEGSFSASIAFNTLLGDCAQTLGDPDWCDEVHHFGPLDDPYEMPAVMACCDAEGLVGITKQVQHCGPDMVEQICRSVPMRIQKLIDDGAFSVGENQAQKLQNWLAEHQQSCFDTLYNPTDTPGKIAPASWLVNEGKNGAWSGLKGFTITLEYAQVDSASLPEDETEYLSCADNDFNNTEIFEETVPLSPGIDSVTHLTEASPGSVMGPKLLGGQVFGVGSFASQASACVAPWCSVLEITADEPAGFWTLEELELYGDGPVSMTNGVATLLVERAAIRLYQVGLGTIHGDRDGAQVYAIPAGEAHFVISGVGAAAVYDVRWGTNASAITVRKDGSAWVVDSFVIEHHDRHGESWIITIPQTTWD